ncbi:MAG: signal peptidase I [Actinobacteria bacterium]|nr:signal peptidase I [Actinomycetota bacterium]
MDFTDTSTEPTASQPPAHDRASSAKSWVFTAVLAVALTILLRATLLQAYSIPSPSMVPTLMQGDRVVVFLLSKDPSRGDIVVFKRSENNPKLNANDPDVLIKRVIGLPGETVNAVDGKVTIDGKVLTESYLRSDTFTNFVAPIVVPEGQLLVLGDNRGNSADSREFGTIDKDLVVGRAVARIWPLDRIGGL